MKPELLCRSIILFTAFALISAVGIHADEYGIKLDATYTDSDFKSDTMPTWSPDGATIAFKINASPGYNILTVSAEGGYAKSVYEADEIDYISIFDMIYSPDGSSLIISSQDDDGMIMLRFDLSAKSFETMFEGFYPSYSPDGRYICYYKGLDANRSDWDIILYDTVTEDSWELAEEIIDGEALGINYYPAPPSFTPDGAYILVSLPTGLSSDPNAVSQQIFGIPVAGGDPVQLTFDDGGSFSQRRCRPRVSPDGNWIIYEERGNVYNESVSMYPARLRALSFASLESYSVIEYKNGVDLMQVEWSPSGDTFCYVIYDSNAATLKSYWINIAEFTSPEEITGTGHWITALGGEEPGPLAVDGSQPEAFATLSNFPNPFNPSTTIEFTLPEPGNAKLVIYDITGRKVRELADGRFSAGTHSLQWNACDDMGKPVSSGVYISRLESGNTVTTNRMTLVR